MTTNKELQNLYDLRFSIKDIRGELERNPLLKLGFAPLILKALDEAYEWVGDLIFYVEAQGPRDAKIREYKELFAAGRHKYGNR
ncbi:hypothetical protein UFOVP1365_41 [uncultured Caudovirales phage]|uniref:Uncharacterized protein n=1 Tax=uncultured Caudovirales phage TaxID=2100421 RepID=A0A6J5RX62_9CAUD|nr:hypothetical protein UFOVP1365_41 [uncultured Caudovirales phage]